MMEASAIHRFSIPCVWSLSLTTDAVDIGYPLRKRFPSNWELSTARAASVVRFLQEKANIKPERLTASGFSFYRPVAPNDTEDTRGQNRRIEIVLVPIR